MEITIFILSYGEQAWMEFHDSRFIKNTVSHDTIWWWFIRQHTDGFPFSVFRRVRPSKINLLHGYGAFLRYRCYAREQFVVPDKKSGTVNRRDYR